MPYTDFMLRDGEELVLDLHPHWWYFASALLAAIGAFVLGAVVLVIFTADNTFTNVTTPVSNN